MKGNKKMALTDEGNGFYMPVAPANSGNGFGFGGDWAWIILLLVLCGGGWGFGGGFGGGWGMGMDYGLYPWLNNSQNINGGFRDQMLNTNIASIGDKITSGFGDVATQLCGGFAGVNQSITNAQMANMQSIYGVQSALQQCCCDNRAGLADVKYTIATENCADRAALSDGIRDLLAATQAQTQTILTQLCNDKLEAKNDIISQLRQELLYARGQASQDVQTAAILAGQTREIDGVYNRLKDCPVPTMPVYGQTPIFTCQQSCGCGCGA